MSDLVGLKHWRSKTAGWVMSDLVERLRNYPYEACELAADRITELEAELSEKNEWNVELDQLNVKLMAQIEAVKGLQPLELNDSNPSMEDAEGCKTSLWYLVFDDVCTALEPDSGVGDE